VVAQAVTVKASAVRKRLLKFILFHAEHAKGTERTQSIYVNTDVHAIKTLYLFITKGQNF
jgi:hypothetical protein